MLATKGHSRPLNSSCSFYEEAADGHYIRIDLFVKVFERINLKDRVFSLACPLLAYL
jgi:hypothetical protein